MTTARPPGGAVISAIPRHPKFGEPHQIWTYPQCRRLDVLLLVARWDLPEGKEIRQFHVNGAGVEWKRPDGKAPLFKLPELLNGGARVLVVAGEKTADAAKKLFPGWSVTTSLGGEGAVAKSGLGESNSRQAR